VQCQGEIKMTVYDHTAVQNAEKNGHRVEREVQIGGTIEDPIHKWVIKAAPKWKSGVRYRSAQNTNIISQVKVERAASAATGKRFNHDEVRQAFEMGYRVQMIVDGKLVSADQPTWDEDTAYVVIRNHAIRSREITGTHSNLQKIWESDKDKKYLCFWNKRGEWVQTHNPDWQEDIDYTLVLKETFNHRISKRR